MVTWPKNENAIPLSHELINKLIQAGSADLTFPQNQALLAALCSVEPSYSENLIGQTNTALLALGPPPWGDQQVDGVLQTVFSPWSAIYDLE